MNSAIGVHGVSDVQCGAAGLGGVRMLGSAAPSLPGAAIGISMSGEGVRLHGDAVAGGIRHQVMPAADLYRVDEMFVEMIDVFE